MRGQRGRHEGLGAHRGQRLRPQWLPADLRVRRQSLRGRGLVERCATAVSDLPADDHSVRLAGEGCYHVLRSGLHNPGALEPSNTPVRGVQGVPLVPREAVRYRRRRHAQPGRCQQPHRRQPSHRVVVQDPPVQPPGGRRGVLQLLLRHHLHHRVQRGVLHQGRPGHRPLGVAARCQHALGRDPAQGVRGSNGCRRGGDVPAVHW
mmetsp:Transcript_24823/g.63307  ORF Transcript_24823/g.63307 Transcript_24823/m.63307 type:complete len:205 (+) Transcript_24823:46-660(+)